MKQRSLSEIALWLQERDDFTILTHRRPDGDTIGCAAALCRGLRQLGKTASILENPQFTEKYRPYLRDLTAEQLGGHVISVDVAAETMFPFSYEGQQPVELLIDHHGSNTGFAPEGYVDASAAACGEIILALLQELGVQPDPVIGEALYLAVSTDTGCFRYSNVTANTLRTAATCKEWGADTFSINRVMFMTKRMARLQLEAQLTQNTEFFADGKVAISAITAEMRRELGITEDDIDDISGFCREIAGVEIGVMLRNEPDGAKLSVRTSPDYDACAICRLLGGGGHKAAAGATVKGTLDEAKAAVLKAIETCGVKL